MGNIINKQNSIIKDNSFIETTIKNNKKINIFEIINELENKLEKNNSIINNQAIKINKLSKKINKYQNKKIIIDFNKLFLRKSMINNKAIINKKPVNIKKNIYLK